MGENVTIRFWWDSGLLSAGPTFASAGPDWKHSCRTLISGVCRNFDGGIES